MKNRRGGILLLLFVGSVLLGGVRVASADCAAPQVFFAPKRTTPGDPLIVRGRFWDDICDDVGGGSCFGGGDGFDSHPTQNIEISLRALGRKGPLVPLGVADADDELDFRLELELPSDLSAGRYRVIADHVRARGVLVVKD